MGTYSLNVPVPASLRRRLDRLQPALTPFVTVRDRPTLVVKRFDGDRSRGRIESICRDALAGVGPIHVETAGVGVFQEPPTGSAPVVYLSVRSRGLRRVHDRLVERLGAVSAVEGDDYTPHVTVARGLDSAGPGGIGAELDGIGAELDGIGAEPGGFDDSVARETTAIRRVRERNGEPIGWTAEALGVWSREYGEIVTRLPLSG